MNLAGEFEHYADWAADVSSLYERLARGVAKDQALLNVADDARDGQPAPQLLLGAVHSLLLGSDEGSDQEECGSSKYIDDEPAAPEAGDYESTIEL